MYSYAFSRLLSNSPFRTLTPPPAHPPAPRSSTHRIKDAVPLEELHLRIVRLLERNSRLQLQLVTVLSARSTNKTHKQTVQEHVTSRHVTQRNRTRLITRKGDYEHHTIRCTRVGQDEGTICAKTKQTGLVSAIITALFASDGIIPIAVPHDHLQSRQNAMERNSFNICHKNSAFAL